MPSIPVSSPLSYVGVFLLLSGLFIVLAGLNIIKIEKFTVVPGRQTLVFGILLTVAGIVFLSPEVKSSFVQRETPAPQIAEAATPESAEPVASEVVNKITAQPTIVEVTETMPAQPSATQINSVKKGSIKILIDSYHGFSWWYLTGKDLYHFKEDGFTFIEAEEPITYDKLLLSDVYMVFFTRYDDRPKYTSEEINAIQRYIRQGGKAFLVGLGWVWENYQGQITEYPINQMAKDSGIFFTGFSVDMVKGKAWDEVPAVFEAPNIASDHPILKGITRVGVSQMLPGALIVNPPAVPLIWGDNETIDDQGNSRPVILAASSVGQGKIVCLQHSSFVEPFINKYKNQDYPDIYDNIALLKNILTWLAE